MIKPTTTGAKTDTLPTSGICYCIKVEAKYFNGDVVNYSIWDLDGMDKKKLESCAFQMAIKQIDLSEITSIKLSISN